MIKQFGRLFSNKSEAGFELEKVKFVAAESISSPFNTPDFDGKIGYPGWSKGFIGLRFAVARLC